jgi:hypothetical protein
MSRKKCGATAFDLPSAERLVHLSSTGRIWVQTEEKDFLDFVRETGLGIIPSLTETDAGDEPAKKVEILACSHLYALGMCRDATGILRRTTAMLPAYRKHVLACLLEALKGLPDDRALADTLVRIDHLGPEMLSIYRDGCEDRESHDHSRWDADIWQAPDAITLLTRVVDRPTDFPELPASPGAAVCFDWLSRKELVRAPSPAPWGDTTPLEQPPTAARHPFWGALTATLDACSGDHHWQVLDLRADGLRCNHVRIGEAQGVLDELWRQELGLFPAAPLLPPAGMIANPNRPPEWLAYALNQMAQQDMAAEVSGSWRLSDRMRRELMRDDRNMRTFESLRQRALALVRAASQRLTKQRGTSL